MTIFFIKFSPTDFHFLSLFFVLLIYIVFLSSLEKVLEAITTAGEWRASERFSPIVQGLRDRSVQLQVSAKQKS